MSRTRVFYRLNSTVSASVTNATIANKQALFLTDPITPGSPFFLPHGTRLMNKLITFMKLQQSYHGHFQEVITPLIYRQSLWEKSGHWENYKEDMFRVVGMDATKEEYGLKPMNCPGHCMVFDKIDRSYNELPVRFSDFSSLHRNESSGSLSGLTRVRRFHQDDGHIFCSSEQVGDEISNTLRMIELCYKVFDINEYRLVLSTRPEESYIGELETWNVAESKLRQVLDATGKPWTVNEGDGAFYGPKIDVLLKDHTGKEHQAATIQLDFQLPERFNLSFRNVKDEQERPIMIHRAIFGSLERFLAILIDHYDGKWPFWMNPRQCIVVPVSEKHVERAKEVTEYLVNGASAHQEAVPMNHFQFYVDMDSRDATVGLRIKDAIAKGYSYIVMIGDKELEQGTIALRHSRERKTETLSMEEVRDKFTTLINSYK